MLHVLIVDDHEIIRRGLRQILADEYPDSLIREAVNAEDAISKLSDGQLPDVVICDFAMPGRSGLEVVEYAKENSPQLPVLILSIHPEEKYAKRVIQAGAAGYLGKESASTELIIAIKKVLQGKKYVSPEMAERLASELDQKKHTAMQSHDMLSDREYKVLMRIAAGDSIIDISRKLTLSPNTISTYRTRILSKMDMKSNAELVKYVIEMNLLE